MDMQSRLKRVIADNSEIKTLERWTPQGRQIVEVIGKFMVKYGLAEPPELPIRLRVPVWSAVNKTLAYIATKGKRQAVRVIHRDGLYERRIYKSSKEKLSSLSISPNGKKIIFQADMKHPLFREKVREVKIVRIEDRDVRHLLAKSIDYYAPAWLADGTKIAFGSGASLWYPRKGYGLWVAVLR